MFRSRLLRGIVDIPFSENDPSKSDESIAGEVTTLFRLEVGFGDVREDDILILRVRVQDFCS